MNSQITVEKEVATTMAMTVLYVGPLYWDANKWIEHIEDIFEV